MNAPQNAPQKRNKTCLFFAGGCLTIILLGACALSGLFVTIALGLKTTEAYKQSLEHAQSHPALIEEAGAPLTPGFFVTGSIDRSVESGSAEISYALNGPRQDGRLYVNARLTAGNWQLTSLTWNGEKGQTLNLLEE